LSALDRWPPSGRGCHTIRPRSPANFIDSAAAHVPDQANRADAALAATPPLLHVARPVDALIMLASIYAMIQRASCIEAGASLHKRRRLSVGTTLRRAGAPKVSTS
jgi:hypothetical protein